MRINLRRKNPTLFLIVLSFFVGIALGSLLVGAAMIVLRKPATNITPAPLPISQSPTPKPDPILVVTPKDISQNIYQRSTPAGSKTLQLNIALQVPYTASTTVKDEYGFVVNLGTAHMIFDTLEEEITDIGSTQKLDHPVITTPYLTKHIFRVPSKEFITSYNESNYGINGNSYSYVDTYRETNCPTDESTQSPYASCGSSTITIDKENRFALLTVTCAVEQGSSPESCDQALNSLKVTIL